MVPENAVGVGTLMQKEVGIVCGLPIVEMICRTYDERLRVELIPGFHMEIIEGRFSDARLTPLLRIRGPMRSLLSAERVILNFLQRMSGVATHTHRYVRRVAGTGAKIYDTRKTMPGMRLLDKYAVRCGGGFNHRIGLFDGLLVKDNHIAAIPERELAALPRPASSRKPGRRSQPSDRGRGRHARSAARGAEGRWRATSSCWTTWIARRCWPLSRRATAPARRERSSWKPPAA